MGQTHRLRWLTLVKRSAGLTVPEEDVAKDVENGLAVPSQGRMQPPRPYNTKESQHDDPADGQRPHRCR
jgi:hypothetical protein